MCLGIPGRVVEWAAKDKKLGLVEVDGERRQINMACIWPEGDPDELLGSWVVTHLGFAMQRITEEQAEESRALLQSIASAWEA